MIGRIVLVVAVLAGCDVLPTRRNPNACCTTEADCDALGIPIGSDCAANLECIDNTCTQTVCQADSDCTAPNGFCAPEGTCVECVESSQCGDSICDTTLHTCRGCEVNSECPLGLCLDGACHASIVPKYLPNVCDAPATIPTRTFAKFTTIDTDDDASCTEIVPQTDGPALCVIRAGVIDIAVGAELRASGSRALALVADDNLTVEGILDISANGRVDGPAGGLVTSGGPATGLVGGGGAGFRTEGAPGGTTVDGGAANAGDAQLDPATLEILRGGTRPAASLAGGGGGAATLISCRGITVVSGILAASGGGGAGSRDLNPGVIAGSGGGSGGYFVLQGVNVDVTGQVFANGGAGGAGKTNLQTIAQGGNNGTRSLQPALGGDASPGAGDGGNGGTSAAPSIGRAATVAGASGGGGGGSSGFLQTYTPAGVAPNLVPSAASPGFQMNLTIRVR
ncbi:MAG: hypothetical protein ABI867_16430 [Kofleriaceae bacterium]